MCIKSIATYTPSYKINVLSIPPLKEWAFRTILVITTTPINVNEIINALFLIEMSKNKWLDIIVVNNSIITGIIGGVRVIAPFLL